MKIFQKHQLAYILIFILVMLVRFYYAIKKQVPKTMGRESFHEILTLLKEFGTLKKPKSNKVQWTSRCFVMKLFVDLHIYQNVYLYITAYVYQHVLL